MLTWVWCANTKSHGSRIVQVVTTMAIRLHAVIGAEFGARQAVFIAPSHAFQKAHILQVHHSRLDVYKLPTHNIQQTKFVLAFSKCNRALSKYCCLSQHVQSPRYLFFVSTHLSRCPCDIKCD